MRIIEIAVLENGAHRNQDGGLSVVPSGWAVISTDTSKLPNFPFGTFEVEERYGNGVMYVIEDSWTPLPIPEPKPIPEPETEMTVWDKLDAAYTEGVNAAYDQ